MTAIDPQTLSLVGAAVVGVLGIYFLSSSSSAPGGGGTDKNANPANSGNTNIAPPCIAGIVCSGVSPETAKEHGYENDPDKDPVNSGLCEDPSGIYDPNKNILEKTYDASTPVGWAVWLFQSGSKMKQCLGKVKTIIENDNKAADAAYQGGNYELAYQLISTVIQAQGFQDEELKSLTGVADFTLSSNTLLDFVAGPYKANESFYPSVVRLRLYSTTYYSFVVCKAQLEARRKQYAMACDAYNDTSIPMPKVTSYLKTIFDMTAAMSKGAAAFYVPFYDPDSDITANTTSMYATGNTALRGISKYDAANNIIATPPSYADTVLSILKGYKMSPNPQSQSDQSHASASSQPTEQQMIRDLVLSSDSGFASQKQHYASSLSVLDYNALIGKAMPLRAAYGRYMKGVAVYSAWKTAQSNNISADDRATIADAADAYKLLPSYIVTDSVGIASALFVIDRVSNRGLNVPNSDLPGMKGMSTIGTTSVTYGGNCNYGGCD